MSKFTLVNTVTCLILTLSISSASHAQQATLLEQIKSCANTSDNTARAVCYEDLGKSVLAAEASGEAVGKSEVAQPTPEVLPEDLGGGKFANKDEDKPEMNRGRVKACQKTANKKWIYLFENDQVWAQVDSKIRRHKSCDFYATITKDNFGYQMLIDGEKRKVRISRRR